MTKFTKIQMCFLGLFISTMVFMSGCENKQTPIDVSKQFWQAIQDRDMEAAKMMSTWDTVEYLSYLNKDKFHPERFELGEHMSGENRAEVQTTLYTSKLGQSGVKLPGVTVLVMTDKGWRVNVKKSMTSVVKYSANNVLDQLNGLMQEGIKGLDESLSDAMNELGQTLEDGAEELKRELSKPLFQPEVTPDNKPLNPKGTKT